VIILEVILVKRSVKATLIVLSKKRTIRTTKDIEVYTIMRFIASGVCRRYLRLGFFQCIWKCAEEKGSHMIAV